MKVLFAVNNENISESIIKRYQQDYKEIISAKNVYYFNAIVKELQRDKSYDRIVISEDLEPFSNNNYDAIEKFIFEKMDNISDEATNQSGNDIPIILICADRREKSDPLLVKLFGIGVYNAILGKDRSITTVCELLNRPRGKKEAKSYYRIDAEEVDYKVENEGDVSETEIQNILNHYKKLGKNEEKYVETFEYIAGQYTDAQLRVIAKFLPLGVKAVLEANSPKYQEAVSFGARTMTRNVAKEPTYGNYQNNAKPDRKAKKASTKTDELQLEIIEKNLNQNKLTKPVVIPSTINSSKVRKMEENTQKQEVNDILGEIIEPVVTPKTEEVPIISGFEELEQVQNEKTNIISEKTNFAGEEQYAPIEEQNVTREQNIPNAIKQEEITMPQIEIEEVVMPQRKVEEPQEVLTAQPKKRGRPRKVQEAPTQVQSTTSSVQEVHKPAQETTVLVDETTRTIDGVPRTVGEEPRTINEAPKKKRGRPRKSEVANTVEDSNNEKAVAEVAPVNLFELGDDNEETIPQTNNTSSSFSDIILPGIDDENMYMLQNDLEKQQEKVKKKNELRNEPISTPIDTTKQPVQASEEKPSQEVFQKNDNQEIDIQKNNLNVQENIIDIDTEASRTIQGGIPNGMPNAIPYEMPNAIPDETRNEIPNAISNFGTATTHAVQNTGKYNLSNVDLSSLLTRDKKIVAFVGTSKNGTSFLVNNLAEMLSKRGIKTALLDLTQNRNDYYIYTENEESLRQIAYSSMENLRKGESRGIEVNKNLTVYTTLPGENDDVNDYANILETLIKGYSLVLLDCDFETNYGYFKEAQEIYLVQSLDVLTIQPLTAFLRDLKAKNVLNPEKIRVALNKIVKVRSITEKIIIGGMAYYNDPAMSFMTELFNKDIVPYCTIPFEEQAYSKYLEGIINCKISLNGYSKSFMQAFEKLANMVYPLIGNGGPSNYGGYNNYTYNTNSRFSSGMNDTLNKMKNY